MKPETKSGLDRYANAGVPTGDFLRAVLENDLKNSLRRADKENLNDIWEIVAYVYNELPSLCHGSPAKVRAWLEHKFAERVMAAEDKKCMESPSRDEGGER